MQPGGHTGNPQAGHCGMPGIAARPGEERTSWSSAATVPPKALGGCGQHLISPAAALTKITKKPFFIFPGRKESPRPWHRQPGRAHMSTWFLRCLGKRQQNAGEKPLFPATKPSGPPPCHSRIRPRSPLSPSPSNEGLSTGATLRSGSSHEQKQLQFLGSKAKK